MIIVRLMGGLGNQMFQYAFAKALALRRGTILKLDTGFLNQKTRNKNHVQRNYDLDIFDFQQSFASEKEIFQLSKRSGIPIIDKILNKLLGYKKSFILEPHFHFSEKIYQAPDSSYLAGYWQTEKYFEDVVPAIRSSFTFKHPLGDNAAKMMTRIQQSNSVCVNVRRGDFLINDFHKSYGVEYFKEAENIMRSRVSGQTYYVFSDDISWCEKNLQFNSPTVFVSHDYAGEKFQNYLRLMAACKHFIIPNSSFAWWAVWLNTEKERIVIAPQKWFNDPKLDTKDLVPETWIRI